MNNIQIQKIIKEIIKKEKIRNMNRIERLLKYPIKTLPFYFLAMISHIVPFKISFKTLWGTKMTSYLPEGNTFYYYGFCEANLTNFLLRFLKKGDIFIDVGAHIGFYSLLASELVDLNGKVFSFEPTPRTFDLLKKNCKKLKNNIKIFNLALSDKEDNMIFFDYGAGYGAYNSGHRNGASMLDKKCTKINIKTMSLDKILKDNNIKPEIIKLDAEGLEYDILKGMKDILNTKNYRPLITLEVAGDEKWKDNYKNSIRELINAGYIVFEMNTKGFIKPHKILDVYRYDNLLFIPEEKNEELKYLYDNN